MKREDILRILGELKEEIRRRFNAEVKGLTGSVARGKETLASDIDVLVDFIPGATLIDYVGLAQYLEELFKCRVDVVPEKDIRRELKSSILRDVIYL